MPASRPTRGPAEAWPAPELSEKKDLADSACNYPPSVIKDGKLVEQLRTLRGKLKSARSDMDAIIREVDGVLNSVL